ncbi:MAG: hypothetical protein EOO18_10520 [Chryseobacterium sp.]|nr:MAG: hypothetical protein EOO18_10520 [Chryseobacterium sp.]
MKLLKAFIIRLLIVAVPLLLLYFYSIIALEANRKREHPTDAAMGIVLLSAFVLLILFICFLADLVKRLFKKEYKIALINIPFLIPFAVFIVYIGCLMTSRDCLCGWLIETIDWMR